MNLKSQTIAGIPMRWYEHGEGVPVVFIHGIPTGPALWRDVVPRMEGAHCLVWEMVGYAGSIAAGKGRDISVARQVRYLINWMSELGLERVVLVGHDLGGGVAQIAAVRHRERCMGLFLTNCIAYDSWPIPSVKALRATRGVVRHLPNGALKFIMSTLFSRGHTDSSKARQALDTHFPPYRDSIGAAALTRQAAALDVQDTLAVSNDIAQLNIPARLAWGVDDKFQKLQFGERLANDLSAPLRRIEGGKHFTPEDHPEVIAEEINMLVQEVRDAREARPDPAVLA